MMDKLALVMAAGEGTRMRSDLPKVLHQVCGLPMLEHVLRSLGSVNAQQYVIVGHNKERVIAEYHSKVEFIEQTPGGWGTGWAIRCCEHVLKGKKGVVLITAGDMPLVRTETFARLISEVESGKHAAALLTDLVDNPFGYGRIVRENGKITGIVEQKDLKPDQLNIKEINASVYCFDIEALLWALPQLNDKNSANEYYLTDVIGILHQGGYAMTTVPVLDKSECMGVNDRVQLANADAEMRKRINAKHMREGVTMLDPSRVYIQPDVSIGKDTIIHPGCEIGKGSVIGEKCVLRAGCQIAFSNIGEGCQLGNSLIKNSTLGSNVKMEHAVARGANIPEGSVIEPFTVVE